MSQQLMPRAIVEALIRPTPGRLAFVLQLTAVCVAITLVTQIYQLPSLATTVYVAFFVYQTNRAATILASIAMPVLGTIALLIALVLTVGVLDHPFWRVCAMATVSFAILFIGSASKLKPLAPTIAMIVGYVLDLVGGLRSGEVAVRGLLYTWLVIAVPAGVATVFAVLAGPAPRRLLEAALAERLAVAATALRRPSAENLRAIGTLLRRGDAELAALLKSAQREHALPGAADLALSRAIAATMAILSYVSLLVRQPADAPTGAMGDAIAGVLGDMAAILRQGSYPIGIVPPERPSRLPADTARLVDLLYAELSGFAEGPAVASPKKPAGFMLPDAFTDPAHVRYALKTTGAAMACYVTFQQLDWPGIHTCLITCYVVSLGSAGETIEKLTLRICGCLIGAALGFAALILVIPQIDGIVALALVVAAGTVPAAWIAAGGSRVSYAGLQVALAYYLIVLQGPSPAFDLSLGRDRIIGVLFGNLMVYLVFTRVWPVSICARIDPAIAGLLRALATMSAAGRDGARHQIGAVRNALAGVRQDLAIARYEPASIRPTPGWCKTRADFLDEVEALQAPLLVHAAESDPSAPDSLLSALSAAAALFGKRGSGHALG